MPSWSVPSPSHDPAPREPSVRGLYLTAVREAWHRALDAREMRSDGLALALWAYARDGRARGVSVATLLRALDLLVRPVPGRDPAPDVDRVREWAGTQVICAYYRAD